MTLVIDSSIALAWFLPDESNPLADRILIEVTQGVAHVPPLFPVEFGNALVMAVRRRRIDQAYRLRTFERMAELGLITDWGGGDQVWTDAVELADVHGLTLYDSMYLELALRTGLPLATLDTRLARAALEIGVLHS